MTDQPKKYLYTEYDGTSYSTLFDGRVGAANDTFTLTDYTSIATAIGFRKDTGAVITITLSANIITVTSALTNVDVLILAWGQRA